MKKKFWLLVTVASLMLTVLAPISASAAGFFTDDDGNIHEANIDRIAALGITNGCNPAGTLYCPDDFVTRAQMASFLARLLTPLPEAATDFFTDDNGISHERNINDIAGIGVTTGCVAGKYCPYNFVTRGQMASFLARALLLPAATLDYFSDDNGSTHEANINKVAAAGITLGCTPAGTTFCPGQFVTRAQMASFLARSLDYGINHWPLVFITSPANLTTFSTTFNGVRYEAIVTLEGLIYDPDLDGVLIQWSSNVDGLLGTDSTIVWPLTIPPGQSSSQPTITLTATDSKGAKTSASIQLKLVVPSP